MTTTIKGEYWAAFRNDGQLASSVHHIPKAYGDGIIYLPVLYKRKRQAKAEGWADVRKIRVVLAD
jgi:hypothetical protein